MFKKFLTIIFVSIVFAFLAQNSFAATTLSLRLEQPQTPTNQSNFNVNFVALTTTGNAITVDCWKKGPGDGAFVDFSTVALAAGGNTGDCPVTSSIVSAPGTYQFAVTGTDGTSTIDLSSAPTVTVAFDSTRPGDPVNYNKSQNGSCQYIISFMTANDGGQTVKVELYRSDSTNFSTDATTRVDSQTIGSNTNGSFTNNVPDCGKTWYFAIRAISSDGNASNPIGDSTTTTTTTVINPTTTQQQGGGALVVANANSQVTQPTGEQPTVTQTTPAPTGETTKNVLGAETKTTPTPTPTSIFDTVLGHKKIFGLGLLGVIVLLGLGYYFFVRGNKNK